MASEQIGLLGRKVGMTQIFDEEGERFPVTVVEAGPNNVLAVKSADGADGYNAIQLGFGSQKETRTNKPMGGVFKKANVEPTKAIREVRVSADVAGNYEAGQKLGPGDVFGEGELVDVTGTSKGRGFAGVMKRYGFAGFQRTHGTHEFFRHGGSIGTRLTPGHVLKGKKMPGHSGDERVTIQNLKILRIDAEANLVFVKGAIPGPNGGLVLVRKATKA